MGAQTGFLMLQVDFTLSARVRWLSRANLSPDVLTSIIEAFLQPRDSVYLFPLGMNGCRWGSRVAFAGATWSRIHGLWPQKRIFCACRGETSNSCVSYMAVMMHQAKRSIRNGALDVLIDLQHAPSKRGGWERKTTAWMANRSIKLLHYAYGGCMGALQ